MVIRRKILFDGSAVYFSIAARKLIGFRFSEYIDIFYSDKKELIYIKPHDERLDGLKGNFVDEKTKVSVKKLNVKNGSIFFRMNTDRLYQAIGGAMYYKILIDSDRQLIVIKNDEPDEDYYLEVWEKMKIYRAKYTIDPEKKRQNTRDWYQRNKEKCKERQRERQRTSEYKAKAKEYYEKNKELISEKHKKWYQENKERIKEKKRKN